MFNKTLKIWKYIIYVHVYDVQILFTTLKSLMVLYDKNWSV